MRCAVYLIFLLLPTLLLGQHDGHSMHKVETKDGIDPQPLLAQAIRLKEALAYLGSALDAADAQKLEALTGKKPGPEMIKAVQEILDPYCIAAIDINPEARVKVERGAARAMLLQGGWKSFLVKVNNAAGTTAKLEVQSQHAAPVLHKSTFNAVVKPENVLTPGQVSNRFVEIEIFRNKPLQPNLSGLKLEYAVLQINSKDAGRREIEIGFNVGQGTQDIGFRNIINILFDIKPYVKLVFDVKDEDGSNAMASFVITDGIGRIETDSNNNISWEKYHSKFATMEFDVVSKELTGTYPLPSRRVAAVDPYPDFFFQPQVYRTSREFVGLNPGKYTVRYSRGPEYIPQTQPLVVPNGLDSLRVSFRLKRWINMEQRGWFSSDHHIHASGCSHYESPEEGVSPEAMWRQITGEGLSVGAVLTWGPSWYYQKNYFTGKTHPLSTDKNLMRYDVEVSGFPSSHAGHICLLRLKEDDYPGTTEIEQWPSYTLPVLRWARSQGALVGYSHSGWGLWPITPTQELPNYVLPKMDNIGANEYIVSVTEDLIDFYSAGDTPSILELNMWYHTLNCGFRPRLSGESDFPCIGDERVGSARSYFKPAGPLSYDSYLDAIKKGHSYISEGRAHLIDFTVNGLEAGTQDSELKLKTAGKLAIRAKAAAYLPETQDESGYAIATRPFDQQPYWHIERSRQGKTRNVAVELIVNGKPVDTVLLQANGKMTDIEFSYEVKKSSWVAIRVLYSAHTNPVFVVLKDKPVRVKKSAVWCRQALDQCWKMKKENIRVDERPAAKAAYDKAGMLYDKIIKEAAAEE